MRDDGESDADSDDSDAESGESDDEDGAEGAAGVDGELASLMAQMDAELQQSQKADDFEMRAAAPKPAAASDAAGGSDGECIRQTCEPPHAPQRLLTRRALPAPLCSRRRVSQAVP